jgi:hypothetical protein
VARDGFWHTRLAGRVATKRPKVPAARSASRGWRSNGYRARHAGPLIATFRCDAPAGCGAFADEGRVLAATKATNKTQAAKRDPGA